MGRNRTLGIGPPRHSPPSLWCTSKEKKSCSNRAAARDKNRRCSGARSSMRIWSDSLPFRERALGPGHLHCFAVDVNLLLLRGEIANERGKAGELLPLASVVGPSAFLELALVLTVFRHWITSPLARAGLTSAHPDRELLSRQLQLQSGGGLRRRNGDRARSDGLGAPSFRRRRASFRTLRVAVLIGQDGVRPSELLDAPHHMLQLLGGWSFEFFGSGLSSDGLRISMIGAKIVRSGCNCVLPSRVTPSSGAVSLRRTARVERRTACAAKVLSAL